jgi:hypothetical protein
VATKSGLSHSSATGAAHDYAPRRAEQTLLYDVVSNHVENFLARIRERGRTAPRFVERELRAFLDCEILMP